MFFGFTERGSDDVALVVPLADVAPAATAAAAGVGSALSFFLPSAAATGLVSELPLTLVLDIIRRIFGFDIAADDVGDAAGAGAAVQPQKRRATQAIRRSSVQSKNE